MFENNENQNNLENNECSNNIDSSENKNSFDNENCVDSSNNQFEENEKDKTLINDCDDGICSKLIESSNNVNASDEGCYRVNSDKKGKANKKYLSNILTGIISSVVTAGIVVGTMFYAYPPLKNYNQTSSDAVSSQANYPNVAKTVSDGLDLTIPQIAAKVGPAVVSVASKTVSNYDDFFFGNQSSESESVGSGIIISDKGYILTNYHVIEGGQNITVILNNKKEVKAKVINYDKDQDIAIIQITDSTVKMPAVAELGDSDKVSVGDTAVAIGNPLGRELSGTVTAGVISALNREIDVSGNGNKMKLLQTDAAINSGNSGGALVNSKGQVIGMNTAKVESSGVEGLGFAIPINTIKAKIQDLMVPMKAELKVGIIGQEISSDMSKQYNIPVGIYVQQVQEFGPAEKAGLEAGDIIVGFDGETVTTFTQLSKLKAKHKAGDKVKIEVVRDGKNKTFDIQLVE